MVKMVTFMLCVFYDNFFMKLKKAQTLETRWLRGACSAWMHRLRGPAWGPAVVAAPVFPQAGQSSRHTGPWGTKQRSQRSDRDHRGLRHRL